MKNQIILMAAAALALASCSKDEMTGVNPGNAIDFRTALTRAAETTTGKLSSIKVTALYTNDASSQSDASFFAGQVFNKSSNSWTSSPVYYWPTSGSLTFYGWAPTSLEPSISSSSKTFEFTPGDNIANQVDFIAVTKGPVSCSSTQGSLALEFNHTLSEIIIQAKKGASNGLVYNVAGVRIGKVAKSGTYDFSSNTWTSLASTKDKYEITYDHPVELTSDAKSIMDGEGEGVTATNVAAMLIPQTTTKWDKATEPSNSSNGSYISVKVQITSSIGAQIFPTNGDEYGWVAVPVAFTWTPGNRYTYVLDFTNGAGQIDPEEPEGNHPGTDVLGGAIDFSVTVTDWGNQTNGTGVDMSNGNTTTVTLPSQDGSSN